MHQAIPPDQSVLHSREPFDDRTDYILHLQQERFQHTRAEYISNQAALDSLTIHRRDYTPKHSDRPRSLKPDEQGYLSNARFDDVTIHNTDYKSWKVRFIQTHI